MLREVPLLITCIEHTSDHRRKQSPVFFLFFVFFMDLSFVSHWCLVSPQNIKRLLLYFWCCFFFFLQSNRIALPRDVNALTSHTPAPRHHSKLTTKCISHWMEYLTDSRNRSHACYSTRFYFFIISFLNINISPLMLKSCPFQVSFQIVDNCRKLVSYHVYSIANSASEFDAMTLRSRWSKRVNFLFLLFIKLHKRHIDMPKFFFFFKFLLRREIHQICKKKIYIKNFPVKKNQHAR